ncbi:MAG: lytic transglycosylase domain-containing protein [Synergistaceae bacterium]|nr:lytic transglycosylase domain-containing protein [Synergistaceae bacterium]
MMKPNMINMSMVLGRIEEIERKGRSFNNFNTNIEVTPAKKSRFVDLLEEEENRIKGSVSFPSLEIDSYDPSNAKIPGAKRKVSKSEWEKYITRYAKEYGVDEDLIRAVIKVESANNPGALSSKGAMGLMQLMPNTAKMLGVKDAWDPEQNIRGGVKYLSQLSDKFDGDIVKMLAGYNAGPSKVDQFSGVPPYAETENYVKKVMALLSDK